MKKITAIYVRRSVSDKDKDNNSLSIESQIADCKKELKEGEEWKVYRDDGKSAKDDNRPEYLQMMADAEEGLIERIIIKKYDRFSRDTLNFLYATKKLKELDVGLISITEKFDTTSHMGMAMIIITITFAEIERKIIADRVMDAYKARSKTTGFYQGGKKYYGYMTERREVNGVKGSVLVPSDRAYVVEKAYEMYRDTNTSLADIITYFKGTDISVPRKVKNKETGLKEEKRSNMDRSHFSKLLQSPLYVKADLDVYQYLFSKGYEMVDDVEAYDGIHGLFRHKCKDAEGYFIKVGYHEGLIDSETWLAVQDKKSHNQRIPNNSGAKNSWLVGLTKCPYCGYSFVIVYGWNVTKTIQWRYYHDNGAYKSDGCIQKRLKIKPDQVEATVFTAMKERLEILEISKQDKTKPDAETERLRIEVIHREDRIKNLMDDYENATGAMRSRINDRVNEIESEISDLNNQIRSRARPKKDIDTTPLREPLNRWDSLTMDEKNEIAKTMIDVVYVSDNDGIDVVFSI